VELCAFIYTYGGIQLLGNT